MSTTSFDDDPFRRPRFRVRETYQLPPVPTAKLRRMASTPDAEAAVEKQARRDVQSDIWYAEEVSTARSTSDADQKRLKRLEKENQCLIEQRNRFQELRPIRQVIEGGLLRLANLPTLLWFCLSAAMLMAGIGCELTSATLQMYNSGWGLTESLAVMTVLIASFVIQPFLNGEMLPLVIRSRWSRRFNVLIAIVGLVIGFWGFYVLANTLGGMAEAPPYSMFAEPPAVETQRPSERGYILSAMVSLWFGTLSACFHFCRCLDYLWPKTAVEHAAYAALTSRINDKEALIRGCLDSIHQARGRLKVMEQLEEAYVGRCLDELHAAKEELESLRNRVRLHTLPMAIGSSN